jgi:hypothetical protein
MADRVITGDFPGVQASGQYTETESHLDGSMDKRLRCGKHERIYSKRYMDI